MAGELIGAGVTVAFNTVAAPTVYTPIPGVTNFETPSLEIDDIEVTALDSSGKEFIGGLGDPGTTTFNINMRKKSSGSGWLAAQQALEAYVNDNLLHGFQISFPAPVSRTYTIQGYVKSFKISGASNAAVVAAVAIKFSGSPVIV